MSKVYISSDYYFNNPDKFKGNGEMSYFGEDACPVDLNWASVPESKGDADNLIEAQETIRRRFSLGK